MEWLLILGGITMPIIKGILATNFGILAGMTAITFALVIILAGVIIYGINEKKT